MPRIRCPYPECTYETEDVTDGLAAVLLSVHSSGTHNIPAQTTNTNPAPTPTTTARVEKVRRPTVTVLRALARIGHISSPDGKTTSRPLKSKGET